MEALIQRTLKHSSWILLLAGLCLTSFPQISSAQAIAHDSRQEPWTVAVPFQAPADPLVAKASDVSVSEETRENDLETTEDGLLDPLEPLNRLSFQFNDKLYFWVFKPLAIVYKAILPQDVRLSIRNFYSNLTTPVRFTNCLLQAQFKCAGNEAARFAINTTAGALGFLDPAKEKLHIEKCDEDFGQTLGTWNVNPGVYIEWPILGSSSLRDTLGFAGDMMVDPRTYLFLIRSPSTAIIRPIELVNDISLMLGEYEDLKQAALDPYIAKRDAYHQYRQQKIRKREGSGLRPIPSAGTLYAQPHFPAIEEWQQR